ncbi:MAG: S-layer homology domain-containing protein [Halothece sp.]
MSLLNYKSVFTFLITLTLITGCGKNFEQRLAPDPKLKEGENSSNSSNSESNTQVQDSESSNQVKTEENQTSPTFNISDKLPEKIPVYPEAELVNQNINSENTSGTLELTSTDSRNSIKSFYEQKLTQENWNIVTPFSETSEGNEQLKARSRNNNSQDTSPSLELIVVISDATGNNNNNSNISIQYQPFSENNQESQENQDKTTAENQSSPTQTRTQFTDLDQTPDSIQPYVRDVAQLGILTPIETNNEKVAESNRFAPNKVITRRTFARWLFQAHNRFYDSPSQQIRAVKQASTPAFQDIPPSDPDFPIIQGLAEAGIIPSRLTGNTTVTSFRPDAPLTRETLLLWKVPLDIRGSLPSADVSTVKETWGFQDAGKIEANALGAVVADFSNGKQSNFRRIYGYTQLFQPNKAVTRAQAATALWLFGEQGKAISAKQLINND